VPRGASRGGARRCANRDHNHAGCAEVIRDGWNGFLVPPGAPRMLAAKILDLLGNRENGPSHGRSRDRSASEEFSLENVVACQAALSGTSLIARAESVQEDRTSSSKEVTHAVRYRDECTSHAPPRVCWGSSIGRECIAPASLVSYVSAAEPRTTLHFASTANFDSSGNIFRRRSV